MCINQPYFSYQQSCQTILAAFSPVNYWSYLTAGISIRWSRVLCRQSYVLQHCQDISYDYCVVSPAFLQVYRYTGEDLYVISHGFSRTIDSLVKTSALLVPLFLRLSIHQSKQVYCLPYLLQDYRCTSQDQCIISPTFRRAIDTLVKGSVSLELFFFEDYQHISQEQCIVTAIFLGLSIHQSKPV